MVFASLVMILFLTAGFIHHDIQKVPEFPEEVGKVLSKSCFPFHTTDATGKDAKAAMDFNMWDEYKLTKKISLLNDINEALKEGIMPPAKFLKSFPDRALSDDHVKLIRDWTQKETEKLMK